MGDDQGLSSTDALGEQGASEQGRPLGGRKRIYGSAAERSKAWRERQRETREMKDSSPPAPTMATSTLGVLLESLIEVSASHERAVADLATRISGAVGSLADPDAVARDLGDARQELADKLRQAQSEVDQANAKQVAAGKAQRLAMSERDEAVAETVQALDRVEELEGEVTDVRAEIKALEEAARNTALDHSQELATQRGDYGCVAQRRKGRQTTSRGGTHRTQSGDDSNWRTT
ncbi:MAG: hypothetical protein ACYDEP_08745 [Acidimicrobiales bacterium]